MFFWNSILEETLFLEINVVDNLWPVSWCKSLPPQQVRKNKRFTTSFPCISHIPKNLQWWIPNFTFVSKTNCDLRVMVSFFPTRHLVAKLSQVSIAISTGDCHPLTVGKLNSLHLTKHLLKCVCVRARVSARVSKGTIYRTNIPTLGKNTPS